MGMHKSESVTTAEAPRTRGRARTDGCPQGEGLPDGARGHSFTGLNTLHPFRLFKAMKKDTAWALQ